MVVWGSSWVKGIFLHTYKLSFILISRTDTWRIIPGLGYVVTNHGDRIQVP